MSHVPIRDIGFHACRRSPPAREQVEWATVTQAKATVRAHPCVPPAPVGFGTRTGVMVRRSRLPDRVLDVGDDRCCCPVAGVGQAAAAACARARRWGSGTVLDGRSVMNYLPFVRTYHSAQLDALGDPTRRAILWRLRRGPMPVGELARAFPISRPAISQHLRVLRHAHLVVDRPAGTRRFYELDPDGFAAARAYLDQFWTDALAAFKARAEALHSEDR